MDVRMKITAVVIVLSATAWVITARPIPSPTVIIPLLTVIITGLIYIAQSRFTYTMEAITTPLILDPITSVMALRSAPSPEPF
jgi:hypothetical protein